VDEYTAQKIVDKVFVQARDYAYIAYRDRHSANLFQLLGQKNRVITKDILSVLDAYERAYVNNTCVGSKEFIDSLFAKEKAYMEILKL
jgi:polysaccharide pyruvyl transferase WcaK-like protein